MKINTVETFSTGNLKIEDSGNVSPVALKIEAAHAGIVNGNYIFYTSKALREGMRSLKEFFKPLQKKHYDKTLGYIYDADFKETSDSPYKQAIENATTKEDLVEAVKRYYYSDDYQQNDQGFGVLVSKARLYDKDKIQNLARSDKGYVSIAGDSDGALCSICTGYAAECDHILGSRYGNEICFAIADSLELDHISFEEIPANWKTNTLIINDSKVLGTVELIEEGQIMKLTVKDFKDALLSNLDNVLTELDLTQYAEAYKAEIGEAKGGDFLFPKEKLLPLNTKLGLVIASKLLDRLEDGEDKEAIAELITKEYTKVIGDTPLEEVIATLEVIPTEPEPTHVDTIPGDDPEDDTSVSDEGKTPVDPLPITDADRMILSIVDSLTQMVDTKLQDLQTKVEAFIEDKKVKTQNAIYLDKIEALEQDLVLAGTAEAKLLEELRTSLLNQITFIGGIDPESDYYKKLAERSVKELQLTLEDHKNLFVQQKSVSVVPLEPIPTDEGKALPVEDGQKVKTTEEPVSLANAITSMTDDSTTKTLAVEDADAVVSKIVGSLGDGCLDLHTYGNLYKQTAKEHGIAAAKKLHVVLKQQYKI